MSICIIQCLITFRNKTNIGLRKKYIPAIVKAPTRYQNEDSLILSNVLKSRSISTGYGVGTGTSFSLITSLLARSVVVGV